MTATVTAFPRYKLNDVPEALRALANRIELGEISAVRIVVAMEPENERCTYAAFGAEPFTRSHAIGLCHAAINEILNPQET